MALKVIDSEGLFNGDRFSNVSDEARMIWPHLWCASNSFARFELNYHKVIGKVFARWKRPPAEEQFWEWIQEFYDACLLFVYEANGQVWGQWDTSAKLLPDYHTAEDKNSPVPPYEAMTAWKDEYLLRKRAKSFPINLLEKLRKNFPLVHVNVHVNAEVETKKLTDCKLQKVPAKSEISQPVEQRRAVNESPVVPIRHPVSQADEPPARMKREDIPRRFTEVPESIGRLLGNDDDGPQENLDDLSTMKANLEGMNAHRLDGRLPPPDDGTVSNILREARKVVPGIEPAAFVSRFIKSHIAARGKRLQPESWGLIVSLTKQGGW